jgi:protein-tyrosine phosphatase
MIQRMKQERKINIFDLVKQLRSQRVKMVQTVDQYAFLYASASELCETRTQQPQGKKASMPCR